MIISVVLPAHNEEAGIEECVRRLLAQDRPVDEIIVVDNASTDDTADRVRRVADGDARVTVIHESRPGVAYARYAGFAAASGDVIASIDSDTHVGPRWSTAIAEAFAHPEVVAGTGPLVMHDLPFQSGFRRRNAHLSRWARRGLERGEPLRVPALSGANSMIRRAAWEQIADEVSVRRDLFEDLDRSILLKQHGVATVLLPGLDATVSGRRLVAGPRAFWRYAACAPRTYAFRGRRAMACVAWVTSVLHLVAMVVMSPANRAWDPAARRFSIARLFGRGLDRRASPIG